MSTESDCIVRDAAKIYIRNDADENPIRCGHGVWLGDHCYSCAKESPIVGEIEPAEIAPGREKLRKRGRGYGLGMVRTSLSQLLNAETPRIRMLDDGRYDVVR